MAITFHILRVFSRILFIIFSKHSSFGLYNLNSYKGIFELYNRNYGETHKMTLYLITKVFDDHHTIPTIIRSPKKLQVCLRMRSGELMKKLKDDRLL